MTINNPLSSSLQISSVTIQWNHDKGHNLGTDKSLILKNVSLNNNVFWTGNDIGPSTVPPIVPSPTTSIPAKSTSTIAFTFHQSYDNWDNTEYVTIDLANPGCNDLFQNQH